MFILFVVYVLVVLWGVKFSVKDKEYFGDYISKDKSTSIKGIFILLVFFSHFNKYATYTGLMDAVYFKIVGVVGQIMVVPFLFYSGYGVMESIKRKGKEYVATIPKNRILKVFLQYAIAMSVVLIIRFAMGEKILFFDVLLTFVCWKRDWFILAIIFLYLFTYLSFKIIKTEKYFINVLLVFTLTVFYIVILCNLKSSYWYDTVLAYPVGMLYSLYREKIEKLTTYRLYKWIFSLLIIGIFAAGLKVFGTENLITVLLGFILTGIFIVIFTTRVSLHNKVLNWVGVHLFEIYLLHQVPIMVLNKIGFIQISPPVSFIIAVTITMMLSFWFAKGYKKLWKLIER